MSDPRDPSLRPSRWVSYLVGLAVGLIGVLWIFPVSVLAGTNEASRYPVVDRGQAITGARYYVADDWHWPLLRTDDLGAPDGVNVAYTDSIPIMAFGAKVLRPLGAGPGYFGYWIVIVYLGQAVGAVYALRAWGVRRVWVHALGAAMAILIPAFLYRSVHPALDGHFVILFALGAAGAMRGEERIWPRALAQSTAAVAALLIHPYLFLMVALIMVGAALDGWISQPDRRRDLAVWAGGTGLVVAVVLVAGGYLSGAGTQTSVEGFGLYSMDIASPVVPQFSGLLSDRTYLDSTGGQREGFNYLGLGLLVLLAVAIGSRTIGLGRAARRHPALVAAVGGMALFAPSATLYFWGRGPLDLAARVDAGMVKPVGLVLVVGLGGLVWWRGRGRAGELAVRYAPVVAFLGALGLLADRLISQFRASGRFFWPLGYLALLAGLVALDRLAAKRVLVGMAIGAVVLGLQVVDTAPARELALDNATDVGAGHYLPPELWEDLIEGHDRLTVAPVIQCGSFPLGIFRGLELTTSASVHLVPVNTSKLARNESVLCPGAEIGVPPEEGELIVYTEPLQFDLDRVEALLADPAGYCRWSGDVVACTRQWEAQPASVLAEFRRPAAGPVRFDQYHRDEPWAGLGWADPDENGRLLAGSFGELIVPVYVGVGPGDLTLQLTVEPAAAGTQVNAELFVGEAPIGRIDALAGRSKLEFRLPAEARIGGEIYQNEIYVDIVPDDPAIGLRIVSAAVVY